MKIQKLSLLIALSIIIAFLMSVTVVAAGLFEEEEVVAEKKIIVTKEEVASKLAPAPVEKVEETKPEEEKPVLLSLEEIAKEVIEGKWGDGEARKVALTKAGYNYDEIQKTINKQQPKQPKKQSSKYNYNGKGLTKSGGVYYNPNTGLKETWYSQKVLPGGGLKIPGRHVNSEGFVCDKDGYICVASSDYKKGTIIETSRGTGKVYDCGCASGILDLYVNW